MKNKYSENINTYASKQTVSSACSDIIEDLLRETYEEENPGDITADYFSNENVVKRCNIDYLEEAGCEKRKIKGSKRKRLGSSKITTMDTDQESKRENCCAMIYSLTDSARDSKYYQNVIVNNVTVPNYGDGQNMVNNQYQEVEDFSMQPTDESVVSSDVIDNYFMSVPYQTVTDRLNGLLATNNNARPGPTRDIPANVSTDNERAIGVSYRPSVTAILNFVPSNFRRFLNDVYGQGDSGIIENIGNAFFDNQLNSNVTVNVTFSFYAKILAFLLTLNTMFFLKLFIWDQLIYPLF